MSFQDSDWTAQAEATAAAPPRRTNPYVAGAIGLGIGIAIGATAAIWALQGSAGHDARTVPTQAATAPHGAASAATATTGIAPSAAAASSVAALPAVAVEPLLPDPPAAAASQTLSTAEVARRKDRAWDRFYRRPAACEGNPSADQLVECGNHFIRSRREFEERWRAGNL